MSYHGYYSSEPTHYSSGHNRQGREGSRGGHSNSHLYAHSGSSSSPGSSPDYLTVPGGYSSRFRAGSTSSSSSSSAGRRSPTNAQRSDANYPSNRGHTFMVFESGQLQSVTEASTRPQGILRTNLVYPDTDPTKRYKCPDCDRRFDRPSALDTHKTTHTKEQPYPCPLPDCGRSFSVKSNMTRHFKTVHQEGSLNSSSRAPVYSKSNYASSYEGSLSPYHDYCSQTYR